MFDMHAIKRSLRVIMQFPLEADRQSRRSDSQRSDEAGRGSPARLRRAGGLASSYHALPSARRSDLTPSLLASPPRNRPSLRRSSYSHAGHQVDLRDWTDQSRGSPSELIR
jgi:hypothetical protein